ncbi:DUF1501 domain-containing protein [Tundrisphaera sp. TA3]|uniref:DUF1501 domain-containing protein n=1 Tax=Tundrisphaera sp. TA3 TaxID=3435775 RepID=UPI003EC05843
MLGRSSRRDWLWGVGGGLGGIALADLLGRGEARAGEDRPRADLNGGLHHPAKARRVIQIFLNGGVSQMDTFDRKPELDRRHGEVFDPGEHVEGVTSAPGRLMKSPFPFRQYGESGRWVSDVFPHLATRVDDLAFVMALTSRTNVHGPASYLMNSGFLTPGFPCLGAWISYGLGALGDNLPTFVVLPDPKGLPYNAKGNFSAGFLPMAHQGTTINASAPDPIPDLFPPGVSARSAPPDAESEGLRRLAAMNRRHAGDRPGDSRLETRIASYELAARMQLAAPEALDLKGESAATRDLYGLDDPTTADFGRRCLLGRRMLERGVRFVQVWSGAGGPKDNWDNHTDIPKELPAIARTVDRPTAGLLADLKARGLLDDTLVIWSTEFGRMPFTQGATGRDHNGGTSVAWLAGAGVKAGVAHGESDPWSWRAASGASTGYDLHATILHLLGIDHERLSVRHDGIDRRLTDVHGHVIREILP